MRRRAFVSATLKPFFGLKKDFLAAFLPDIQYNARKITHPMIRERNYD